MTNRFEQAFIDLADGKPLDINELIKESDLLLKKRRTQAAGADLVMEDPAVENEELLEAAGAVLASVKALMDGDEFQKMANADEHLLDFCEFVDHTSKRPAHLEMIAEKLREVEKYVESGGKEGIGRLIISMPPRHGKTQTVSKRWPARLLGRNPLNRIAMISYGQDLALEASREVRDIIRDSYQFRRLYPNVKISDESQSVGRWSVDAAKKGEPSVIAVGIGGPLIGRGFHYVIIDDPLKGRAEAESETMREGLKQWYRGTLYHRLEPGGAIVIIQTRWHEDDLVGFLLDLEEKGEGDHWEYLNVPALAEEDDVLGREPGAALWPERYDREVLLRIKKVLGGYDWESQFQGHPKPPDGAKIMRSWFGYISPQKLPKGLHWHRYWDLAVSSKQGASRTASCRVAFDEAGNLYISGMLMGQWEWPEQKRIIKRTMLAEWPLGVEHGIEKALHGIAAVQEFRQDKDLHGVAFRGIDVAVDKLTRALPWIGLAEGGMIYLVDGPWNEPFLAEATVFTGHKDKYDDQIDAVSGAVQMASYGNLTLESGENPFYD